MAFGFAAKRTYRIDVYDISDDGSTACIKTMQVETDYNGNLIYEDVHRIRDNELIPEIEAHARGFIEDYDHETSRR